MSKSLFRRLTKRFFEITNIIVALLFLLGCYGYWLDPSYAWPVGFLTLTAFYFLLFLIAFIFFWVFVKPWYVLISIVAILLAVGPLTNIIPFRFSGSFNKSKPSIDIRVMSWNVAQFNVLKAKKHPAARADMISLVNEYQPDIACFQEMVAEDSTVKNHGHIDEFLSKLSFSNYHYSYNSRDDFWGYAHFGIIIFSRYPIINKKTVTHYPNDYNSIFQYADILKDQDTIRVFNIHLQSLRFSMANLKYIDDPSVEDKDALKESKSIVSKFKKGFLKRKTQAEWIGEEISRSPYPVIVCGDFNDVPNSYAYHRIGQGLQNAFAEKGTGLGRTFTGISPVLRIDNIFSSKSFQVDQFTRVNRKLSDHFPIVADLQLPKK